MTGSDVSPAERARNALAQGNLSLAEGLCVEALQRAGPQFEILGLLAQTYRALGMEAEAARAARQALTLVPDDQPMVDLRSAPAQPGRESPAPRFLVIKAWGQGFWSDVSHVLGCCLLCEMTGRIPVTDWGSNSLFANRSGGDGFRTFFEPISDYDISDLTALDGSRVFPNRWTLDNLAGPPGDWRQTTERIGALYFLSRPEQIAVSELHIFVAELAPYLAADHPMAGRPVDDIYRYLASRYLTLRPDIAEQAEAFFATHLAGSPVVAVHLRGSDKGAEVANLDEVNAYLLETAALFEPPWRIFLLSDDQRLVDRFVDRFGERAVVSQSRRTTSDTGVHFQEGDGSALARDLLIDSYVALACHRFLGAGISNVAAMIDTLKDWPAGTSTLVGDKLLNQRSLHIYSHGLPHGTVEGAKR